MSNINKIIFAGATLRNDIVSVMWFYNLFKYSVKRVTGLDTFCATTLKTDQEDIITIDVEKIYRSFGIEYQDKDYGDKELNQWWASIYYNKEYNKEFYDYVYSVFKDSLVISYELDECMLNALDYLGIPYIETNQDPIRFLEDSMICFRTPNKKAYEKILKYRVSEDFIRMSANYLKTAYCRYEPILNSKDVLFLGQTQADKTLVDETKGEIYSILNHKEEFISAVKGFDNIYYKRHPFAQNDEEILEFVKSLGNVRIIDGNFYEMISQDNIKKVVSISSGTCGEALYFDKEIQYLLRCGVPRQIEDKFDKYKYVSVYQDFFSLNFWSDILEPFVKTEKFNKLISIAGSKNKLRNSRNQFPIYYSYEDMEQKLIFDTVNNKFSKQADEFKKQSDEFKKKLYSTLLAFDMEN